MWAPGAGRIDSGPVAFAPAERDRCLAPVIFEVPAGFTLFEFQVPNISALPCAGSADETNKDFELASPPGHSGAGGTNPSAKRGRSWSPCEGSFQEGDWANT
jgi:hypothetical protein